MGNRLARHSAIAAGLGLALVLTWIFWPRHTLRLLVGVDDDTLKWTGNPVAVVRWQHELGADAVRVWVPWHGEQTPRGARLDELARAEQAAKQTTVVLAIFGFAHDTPQTTALQSRYCGYARRVLALVPHARGVVVWNEANSPTYWSGTPAEYERLLARCYDALHRTGLTILDSTASAHAPATFLRAVAAEYKRTSRNAPIVDAFGHNPYPETASESPAATHAAGFLGEGDYARLRDALRAFGSPDVWYLEDGFQSSVPSALRAHYNGHETVPTVSAEGQAARLQSAIAMAACQPHVKAFFNFELVDETRLAGWQSGLVWRGVHRKPAAAAFASAPRSCK
jgi:type III secretion system FlhB-like substrate exporter